MNDHSEYIPLGSFSIRDTKSICDVFEIKDIGFELEIDESAIREMAPTQAALGGTYGHGSFANIYVDPNSLALCESIVKEALEP